MKYAVLVDRYNKPVFCMVIGNEQPDIIAVYKGDNSMLYHLEESGIVDVYKESLMAEVQR